MSWLFTFFRCRFFFSSPPREGVYVYGLYMEGARWDTMQGVIMESHLKELFPMMPVINIRVSWRTTQQLEMQVAAPRCTTGSVTENFACRLSHMINRIYVTCTNVRCTKRECEGPPTYGRSIWRRRISPRNGFWLVWRCFCRYKTRDQIRLLFCSYACACVFSIKWERHSGFVFTGDGWTNFKRRNMCIYTRIVWQL